MEDIDTAEDTKVENPTLLRGDNNLQSRGLRPYKRVITADNWKPIHEKILSYKIMNTPHVRIAKICGVSEQTVRNVIRSPHFVNRLQGAREVRIASDITDTKAQLEEARGVLSRNIMPAVQKLAEIMASGQSSDRIQLDAAQAILDRAGLAKSTIVENVSRNYSPEELESARNTLLEIESITARVSTSQSKFILRMPVEHAVPKEQDAVGELLPASIDRPEALST